MTILQTLMGVIEQKHASSTLILDCDFNDSEFFDVKDNEPFPWIDEEVEIKFNYNSKSK